MPRSILLQTRYDPKHFNEQHLMRMIAHHMVRFPDIFYPYIKGDLGDQSYVSYCRNIFSGQIWGDDVMLAALGHMWNVSITLLMPYSDPLHLFHDDLEDPDIVIVANGGPPESQFPSTHFSATKSRLVNHKVTGSKTVKLTPKIYDSYDLATKVAKNRMEERLKRTVFDRLRQINFEIDDLDQNIQDLQANLKKAKQTRTNLERDLLEMGFNIVELRSLRKDKGVSEKYIPETVSATDTQGATAAPVYVPTPKQAQAEPMETEQSVEADVEMPEVQEMPGDQTLQTGRTVSKKTLEAIGLAPDKWAQILEMNKQAPPLPSLDPFDVSSGIPPLPETAALLPSVLPQVTLPAVPQTTTMPEVSQAVLSAVTQPSMSQGMMSTPSQETVSATIPSQTFAPPAAPSTHFNPNGCRSYSFSRGRYTTTFKCNSGYGRDGC